ncbi:MAG TPA: LD-carboxypeptidase [Candidatus Dormibacteraeota bacterium]|nr:LD-carboxypeptidase [Candidatus Dormibacteraeota bacterium]
MPHPLKPPALRSRDAVRVLSLASPVNQEQLQKGCEEISRLGYAARVEDASVLARESFFAGSAGCRRAAFEQALSDKETRAVFCSRGGYGSNYLIEGLKVPQGRAKIFLGSSDITSLQIFLWQKFGWVTFYGPMVASNFHHGPGGAHGYDQASLIRALTETAHGWELSLDAETPAPGQAEGVLLGGCLTLIETSLGTPWELDTRGAILVLEDRGMKPYQVDRALMHLKQAGKFDGVAAILFGDFPECDPPAGGETVRDVVQRIFTPMISPMVWGAPVGHTERAALTLPLGVRARLSAPAHPLSKSKIAGEPPALQETDRAKAMASSGAPKLQILEPACVA